MKKEDIIHRLQDEVIFLQELKEDVNIDNYVYTLKGDLSESRSM